MASIEKLNEVISYLKEIEADATLPKNVKNKLGAVIKLLEAKGEVSIKVSKALNELEQLAEDMSTPSEVRTQLFGVTSKLEVV